MQKGLQKTGHAEFISASRCLEKEEILNQVQDDKKGFALIELLVVVLIISILAAVAMPQYNKAVAKTRYMNLVTAAKSFKDAMENYYMEQGAYPHHWSEVDITYPGCVEIDYEYMLGCDSFAADLYLGADKNLVFYDTTSIPNYDKKNITTTIARSSKMKYTIWLDHSTNPGKQECWSSISGLCKSLGFN